jgi:AcrR family transcriptional regulator
MADRADDVSKRAVGRPRQFDDDVERRLILDAAYAALRDRGADFTIANILSTAGVSTRSFYRHFDSKDALLHAMYLRDGEWAAERLTKRLADAGSPREAVEWWIDEIFGFTRSLRRAERVSVLGSITGVRANGADEVTARGRELLVEPLHAAI